MLKYFYDVKMLEVAALDKLKQGGLISPPWPDRRPGFLASLRQGVKEEGLAIIAEYKRASPSQGDICLDLSPQEVVKAYVNGGARAISVLTESTKFKGSLEFLEQARAASTTSPLLRKDFIIDPLQVEATAATAASAILLIVKLTPQVEKLRQLRQLAESYGLEAVVEVFDQEDLLLARKSGAKVIQVNSRNLNTLAVDTDFSLKMAHDFKRDSDQELWISASGLETPADLEAAREAGFEAVLIGTSLMRGGDPAASLKKIRSASGRSRSRGQG